MHEHLRKKALEYLRTSLNNPDADFREGQWEAISKIAIDRSRLLIVQRTGWGKSIVYFIATRLLRDRSVGPTLLISPLLALIRNQIDAAKRIHVNAATINSSNKSDWQQIKERLHRGEIDILLISPERLANDDFRESVLLPVSSNIGLFVVDEAHCISDWGHDFRPDYRRIVRMIQSLPPGIPVLATTATANDRVIQDIHQQLGEGLEIIHGSLVRPSLRLQNINLVNPAARLAWLAEHLPGIPGSGVIYTLTVRDSQRVAEWLQSQGIDAYAYWGGLENDNRVELEQKLVNNEIKALIATPALGMGFDKPDLAFVIHYQRPGSVIHYYQQVGRAGRAVDSAYGIMLSGEEDEDITNYFINTAFPPETHAHRILSALNKAKDGLSVIDIEEQVNISRKRIEKVLKILLVEPRPPVVKRGHKYYATPVKYGPDYAKVKQLTELRIFEQHRMRAYLHNRSCLMMFLQNELNDPYATPCKKCSSCTGKSLLPVTYSQLLFNEATEFLKRLDQPIEVRKRWPGDVLVKDYGWKGNIPEALQMEPGRVLCLWGDPGWGTLVRHGKQIERRFPDELVDAVIDMILQRWNPDPFPEWITCVPSLSRPELVPEFAEQVANKLNLPLIDCVEKLRETRPQKEMQNSAQQAKNITGAFGVRQNLVRPSPLFLIDDMVDSRWTFTLIAALLKDAGSGPVYPLALSTTAHVES
jgi:ATP-dependent DNA helicase RecQ